jgi:hypothetical protein
MVFTMGSLFGISGGLDRSQGSFLWPRPERPRRAGDAERTILNTPASDWGIGVH